MDNERPETPSDEPAELEPLEELLPEETEQPPIDSPEFAIWSSCHLHKAIPSLFLDDHLRILHANGSFRRMFGCGPEIMGMDFTQFNAPFFNDARSADLFHSIESSDKGFTWRGSVEKIGTNQLRNISKVWITPLRVTPEGRPGAYSAIYLDYTDEHRYMLQNTFASLLEAARLKDNDTGNHIERVNRYGRVLAQDLADGQNAHRVGRDFIESIGLVAALHDIGKIGTPDDILNKARQLEQWEWEVMKQHTINGSFILSTYPNRMAQEIALRHHEHWDGSGYPHGLAQELIPLSARIVAVGDVYDALRMRRAYKDAYSHEQAVDSMVAESGTHFDPFLIKRFMSVAGIFRDIFSELADSL